MQFIEDAAGIRGREVIPRVIPAVNPQPGADFSFTVPGGALWYVETLTALLVTSAAAGNRSVGIRLSDGSNVFATVAAPAFVAASVTARFSYFRGFGVINTVTGLNGPNLPFPSVPLVAGFSLSASTNNMDVADQWSQIVLYVLEIEERPYDVELARDYAALRGNRSNAYPEIREGL